MGLAFGLLYAMFALMIIMAIFRGTNALPAALMTVVVAFSLTSAALHQEYYWMLLAGTWALVETRVPMRGPLGRNKRHIAPANVLCGGIAHDAGAGERCVLGYRSGVDPDGVDADRHGRS